MGQHRLRDLGGWGRSDRLYVQWPSAGTAWHLFLAAREPRARRSAPNALFAHQSADTKTRPSLIPPFPPRSVGPVRAATYFTPHPYMRPCAVATCNPTLEKPRHRPLPQTCLIPVGPPLKTYSKTPLFSVHTHVTSLCESSTNHSFPVRRLLKNLPAVCLRSHRPLSYVSFGNLD